MSSSGESKLSALARARKSTKGLSGITSKQFQTAETLEKPLLVRKTNLGARFKRPLHETELNNIKQHESENVIPKNHRIGVDEPMEQESGAPEPMEIEPLPSPQTAADIRIEVSVDLDLLRPPTEGLSQFIFGEKYPGEESPNVDHSRQKRRRLASDLFHAYTNKDPNLAKAKANFASPSPDDKVLAAQKQAFEEVARLKISETSKASSRESTPVPGAKATKPFVKIDLAKELAAHPSFTKPHKSFVIIGHVDAGKSTLMGRILFDTGAVDAKTVNKLVREAEKSGMGSFALAWIMDQTSEERSRGVTIDICATNFETPSTNFTAIDAPGHKDFVPQMIGGVSQADIGLLVVDSITGEFEAGFTMDGQTKEHTVLARNLGVTDLCVAVNKMDKEQWSEDRFEDIKEQLTQFLISDEVGYNKENISFVPISGLTGGNVFKTEIIPELAWYKGPTLVEALAQIGGKESPASAEVLENADFNLAINDIYDVTGSDFKIKGKVTQGVIQPGQSVRILPDEHILQVQNVSVYDVSLNVAIRGQIALLLFKVNQLNNKNVDELSIGDIVVGLSSGLVAAREFGAEVTMFNMSKPLLVGTPIVLFRNNASVSARILKIIKINGSKKKKMHLVSKQTAEVEIEVLGDKPLPVAKFSDNKSLGRVVIRREGHTIGAGTISRI